MAFGFVCFKAIEDSGINVLFEHNFNHNIFFNIVFDEKLKKIVFIR